jgi:biotin carboxylase
MEMNTRIQAEHPIPEVIDYDLILWAILVAAGVLSSGKIIYHNYKLSAVLMQKILIMIFVLHQENYVAHARRTWCTFRYTRISGYTILQITIQWLQNWLLPLNVKKRQ